MKLALFSILLLVAQSSLSSNGAIESVRISTDDLLAKLVEIQPLYESDQEKFFSEVDQSLAPFIDFDGFSRGVMAKYYRRANDEQKSRFSETFRTALVKTYSKALVEFDNQEVIVLDNDHKSKRPDRATVDLEVHAKDGTVYPIQYSLALVDDQWKLRNVVINGINIGLQFRGQFANYMQQYRNNIDDVIDNWNVDV